MCIFEVDDVVPDKDVSCTSDFAVAAQIKVVMAGCRASNLNLTAMATAMSAVINVSACALELSFESFSEGRSSDDRRRRLLQEGPGATLVFGLVMFVPDEVQGNIVLSDLDGTMKLATLLALIKEDVGDVVSVNVTAVLVRPRSATSDPHFVTARGSKFDFNGEAGRTYCVVTDTQLQINARFVGATPDAALVSPTNQVNGKPDTRTWMDQVAILHGSDRVLVEAASPQKTPYTLSFGTVSVNGELVLGRTAMIKLASGLTVARSKTRVVVTVPDVGGVEVQVVRAEFWQPGSGPGHNFLNLQVKQFTGLSHAHGILGQSLGGGDGDIPVDGTPQDYQTTSIFAADCRYNQFRLALN
eukprot:jgi/Mesvir1/23511/Mv22353-RA.1